MKIVDRAVIIRRLTLQTMSEPVLVFFVPKIDQPMMTSNAHGKHLSRAIL